MKISRRAASGVLVGMVMAPAIRDHAFAASTRYVCTTQDWQMGPTRLDQIFNNAAFTEVVVTQQAGPWISDPMRINRRSHLTIIFEPGVEVRGSDIFEINNVLLLLNSCSDVTVQGGGALLSMPTTSAEPGEWQHAISMWGCTNIVIRGLTIRGNGGTFGDGVYVGSDPSNGTVALIPCQNIRLIDLHIERAGRNGISVINVIGLTIQSCRIIGTTGTNPMAGIDFEPNFPSQRLGQISVIDCLFRGSTNAQALFAFANQDATSQAISITFANCRFEGPQTTLANRWGVATYLAHSPQPQGQITFSNCYIAAPAEVSAFVCYGKASNGPLLKLINTTIRYDGQGNAIWIADSDGVSPATPKFGGIDFTATTLITKSAASPTVCIQTNKTPGSSGSVEAVTGTLAVVGVQPWSNADLALTLTQIRPDNQVGIGISTPQAVTAGNQIAVTVTRPTAQAYPIPVKVTIAGTALEGVNVARKSGVFNIGAGVSSATYQVDTYVHNGEQTNWKLQASVDPELARVVTGTADTTIL